VFAATPVRADVLEVTLRHVPNRGPKFALTEGLTKDPIGIRRSSRSSETALTPQRNSRPEMWQELQRRHLP
jgi:hypothetical protein